MAKTGRLIGLFGMPSSATLPVPLEKEIISLASLVVLTVVLGTCFGLIYSRIYDIVPGKGVRKGLYFGLLILFIKDIAAGAYLIVTGSFTPGAPFEWIAAGVSLIVLGFYMWITYGLVLGYLYRK